MKNQSLWFVIALLVLSAGCSLGTPTRPSEFNGKGYPALVRAMSTGVARLSQEIAEQVAVNEPGGKK